MLILHNLDNIFQVYRQIIYLVAIFFCIPFSNPLLSNKALGIWKHAWKNEPVNSQGPPIEKKIAIWIF